MMRRIYILVFSVCLLVLPTAFAADVTGEHTTLSNQTISAHVSGNYTLPSAGDARNVTGNSLKVTNITGGSFWAIGGFSRGEGIVSNNTVTATGGDFQSIYGGRGNGDVTNNKATMTGVTVANTLYGGYSVSGNSLANELVMNSGSADTAYGGYTASTSTGSASNNKVLINGGTVTARAAGGVTGGTGTAATNNSVIVRGGTIAQLIGGRVSSGSGTGQLAEDNSVEVFGGTISGDIYGGYVGGSGNAVNNTVTLHGGTFNGRLFGGFIAGTGDNKTGNTLNVKAAGISATGLFNFETLNFYVPGAAQAGDTLLTISGEANINNSVINIGINGSSSQLQEGDAIKLITAGFLTGSYDNASGTSQGMQGISLLYEFALDTVGNRLTATVTKAATANPATESLPAGQLATLNALRQGGDLAADGGIGNLFGALDLMDRQNSSGAYASLCSEAGWSGPAFFAAANGGHYSLKSGHRSSVDGFSAMVGMGVRNRAACGSLLLGAFFETGYADYDNDGTYGGTKVSAGGDSKYYGVGVLARHDWSNGFYAEASARFGMVKNKYHTNLRDTFGNRANYDLTSTYYGAHGGIGYKFRPNANSVLDLSAKYLWTRQGRDTTTLATGERVYFKANDSSRVRVGARYSYNFGCVAPYAGAAWEYEFDGKARAGTATVNYGSPGIKGGTGIGEIGVTYRRNSFAADLGVQGHVGKREAIVGSLRVGWGF